MSAYSYTPTRGFQPVVESEHARLWAESHIRTAVDPGSCVEIIRDLHGMSVRFAVVHLYDRPDGFPYEFLVDVRAGAFLEQTAVWIVDALALVEFLRRY